MCLLLVSMVIESQAARVKSELLREMNRDEIADRDEMLHYLPLMHDIILHRLPAVLLFFFLLHVKSSLVSYFLYPEHFPDR